MSNLGLERFLESQGLGLERTKVGDRYVVERMRETGINLGGEQSGHMILSDFATTGDGLVAALQVLATIMAERPAGQRGVPPFHAAAAAAAQRAFRGRPAAFGSARAADRGARPRPGWPAPAGCCCGLAGRSG